MVLLSINSVFVQIFMRFVLNRIVLFSTVLFCSYEGGIFFLNHIFITRDGMCDCIVRNDFSREYQID